MSQKRNSNPKATARAKANRISSSLVGDTICEIVGDLSDGVNTPQRDAYAVKLASGNHLKLAISNGQWCCERWGIHVHGNKDDMIGAKIISVVVDIGDHFSDKCDVFKQVSVAFSTDKGPLKIEAYNEHNGYYSHDVHIRSRDAQISGRL